MQNQNINESLILTAPETLDSYKSNRYFVVFQLWIGFFVFIHVSSDLSVYFGYLYGSVTAVR